MHSYEQILCPILEVHGPLVSDEMLQRMEKVGNQYTSVGLAGAGHVLTVDKSTVVIQATRSLSSKASASGTGWEWQDPFTIHLTTAL